MIQLAGNMMLLSKSQRSKHFALKRWLNIWIGISSFIWHRSTRLQRHSILVQSFSHLRCSMNFNSQTISFFHPLSIHFFLLYANIDVVMGDVQLNVSKCDWLWNGEFYGLFHVHCFVCSVHFAIIQLLRQFNRFFIELYFLFFLFFNSTFLTYSIFALWSWP